MQKFCLTKFFSPVIIQTVSRKKAVKILEKRRKKEMTKKSIANETFESTVELTQRVATVTLKTAVQAAEVAENYAQAIYKAGYDANVEALKVAKGYWDATSQIRQDWIKLFANTGENIINSAAKGDLPLQKQVIEFAKSIFNNLGKAAETAQAKATSK
jgi:hypothetical protein